MENLKISRTVMPEKPMSMNAWFKKYKVGSRYKKYSLEDTRSFMNQDYDFSKLKVETEKLGFSIPIKISKLLSI